jgi:hypothetical protein
MTILSMWNGEVGRMIRNWTSEHDGEDVRGMTCCDKGRTGDGHACFQEALFQQQRNQSEGYRS